MARKPTPLTLKQEAFATAIANGQSRADAYRGAYDAAKMTQGSLHVAASRLLKVPKVALRVQELRAPTLRKHEVSAARTTGEIATAAYGLVDGEILTWSAKLKALEMLARIDGLFEKDNRQFAPNLAIQINYVDAPPAKPNGHANGANGVHVTLLDGEKR